MNNLKYSDPFISDSIIQGPIHGWGRFLLFVCVGEGDQGWLLGKTWDSKDIVKSRNYI